jgi:hypothetical protein
MVFLLVVSFVVFHVVCVVVCVVFVGLTKFGGPLRAACVASERA